MKLCLVGLAILFLPACAAAQDITCKATSFCNGNPSCESVDNSLTVTLDDTEASFEFDSYDPFEGRMTHTENPIVIVSLDGDTNPFILVINVEGEGVYSVVPSFDGWISPGFFTLECEVQ